MENSRELNWALGCHLSALSMFIGIPFGNIIGPLIIWLIKREEMLFVNEQGKEALNFQISMSIYSLVAFFLSFVFIGFFLIPVLLVLNVVFVVIAAVKSGKGENYKYPMTIRFVK